MTTVDPKASTQLHCNEENGVWECAQVDFSPDGGWLSIGNRRIELDHRSANLLRALAEAGGRAVSKDELMGRAWPGRLVHENSLAKAISKLRLLLTGSGIVIVTVHGVGYRLERSEPQPVRQQESGALSTPAAPAAPVEATSIEAGVRRWRERRSVLLAGALVAAVGLFSLAVLEWGRGAIPGSRAHHSATD